MAPEAGLVRHGRILVTPALDAYLNLIDTYTAIQGGTVTWTSGRRTPAEQADLFDRWRRGDPNVPFEPLPYEESKHATGNAADGEIRPAALQGRVGAYAQALGLGWSPREPWHFELPRGSS